MVRSGTQHPWWLSVILHLLPKVALVAGSALVTPLLLEAGYPWQFSAFIVLPALISAIQLALLWYAAPLQSDGRRSLRSVITFQASLDNSVYWLAVPLIAIYGLVLRWLLQYDPWLSIISANLTGTALSQLAASMMLAVFSFGLMFFGVLFPIVEELYYRGFLLPRLPAVGWAAPLVHILLYGFLPLQGPWETIMRFAMVIPLVLVVWKQRSVYLGMVSRVIIHIGILMYLLTV